MQVEFLLPSNRIEVRSNTDILDGQTFRLHLHHMGCGASLNPDTSATAGGCHVVTKCLMANEPSLFQVIFFMSPNAVGGCLVVDVFPRRWREGVLALAQLACQVCSVWSATLDVYCDVMDCTGRLRARLQWSHAKR